MAFTPLQSTTTTKSQTLDPRFEGIFNQLQGQIGAVPQFGPFQSSIPNYGDYTPSIPNFDFNETLRQAFRGPYFQTVSGGLLNALQPQFATQRQQLQDQFRSAGTMPSSAFAQGMGNLMGQQGLQQNQLLSSLANSLLGSSLQAGQLGLSTAMGREELGLAGRRLGVESARARDELGLAGNRLSLEAALAPLTASTNLLRSLPVGESITASENVDTNALINMLMTLKGSTGGGGGESFENFQQRMAPPSANPFVRPTTGASYGGSSFTPGPGYDPNYGTQSWIDQILGGGGAAPGTSSGAAPQDEFGYSYTDWMNDPFYSSNYGSDF